jgi:hypothetical protein
MWVAWYKLGSAEYRKHDYYFIWPYCEQFEQMHFERRPELNCFEDDARYI